MCVFASKHIKLICCDTTAVAFDNTSPQRADRPMQIAHHRASNSASLLLSTEQQDKENHIIIIFRTSLLFYFLFEREGIVHIMYNVLLYPRGPQ